MASELTVRYTTGATVYAVRYRALDAKWYDVAGAQYEAALASSWGDYAVTMTEVSTSGFFVGSDPDTGQAPGTYIIFAQAGGSPASTDNAIATGSLYDESTIASAIAATPGVSSASVGTARIKQYRGDTWSIDIEGLGSLALRSKLWFTVKADDADVDASSWIQVLASEPADGGDGLLYVYGGSPTLGNASITVSDAVAGDITIDIEAVETAKLPVARGLVYDVQMLDTNGDIRTLATGTVQVLRESTRATS